MEATAINWASAPGATHYHPKTDYDLVQSYNLGYLTAFFLKKRDDGVWEYTYGAGDGDPYWSLVNMAACNFDIISKNFIEKPEQTGDHVIDALAHLNNDDFEYPLPPWAIARNPGDLLVPGTQLCTKDGRRTGNAHVIRTRRSNFSDEFLFDVLTDAGNIIRGYSRQEILGAFWIGPHINCVQDTLAKFDREGHFVEEPK